MLDGLLNKRQVGIIITDKLKVYVKDRGIVLDQPVNEIISADDNKIMNVHNYWLSHNDMERLFKESFRQVGSSLLKPEVFLTVPHEITINDCNRIPVEACISAGSSSAYIASNIITAAVGSKLPLHEMKKNIFIYNPDFEDKIYFAVLYAGSIINFLIIRDNVKNLTESEMLGFIDKLLQKSPRDISEEFKLLKDKALKEKLMRNWKSGDSKQINICAPDEYLNQFAFNVGKYELNKLKYKDCLLNGIRMIIDESKNMKKRVVGQDK